MHEAVKNNGIPVICNKTIAKSVLGYSPTSGRNLNEITEQPVNITLVQLYKPTLDVDGGEINEFSNTLQQITYTITYLDVKGTKGNWNADVLPAK